MPACPVCSNQETSLWSVAKDYEYFSTDKEYSYFHCNICYTIFIDPIPINELQTIYPPNYYSFVAVKKNFVVRTKEWLDKKIFQKQLQKISAAEINLLDVGGGTGWLATIIKKQDERIKFTQIVDIDKAAKKIAEDSGHAYYEGMLESFSTEKKFHLILMLNLIEHVSDPLAVLNKAASFLADDGIIVIKTPNANCVDARLFKKSYWGGLHAPRHWVIFSEKSFRQLLTKTDLTISSLKYSQGAAFWAFSFIVWLYKKKLVKISAKKPIVFHPLFALISACFAALDFIRCRFSKTAQQVILLKKTKS